MAESGSLETQRELRDMFQSLGSQQAILEGLILDERARLREVCVVAATL